MSKARELLWPTDSKTLVRFGFLYVGQGLSTIVLARDGASYKALLVDINLDGKSEGINVPQLVSDLLDGGSLDVFVNTHPHDDHLRGLVELVDGVGIGEVWHSGHKPGRKHDDAYKDLQKVIEKVKKNGGRERKLEGSREQQTIGEAAYYVLAPAEYVVDEIAGEDQDTRDRRIHEQCAVLKFGTGNTWGMLPGDADCDAFEKHIAQYHKERLSSIVLSASHHGSRTFFRYDEKDEPYLDGLDYIDPRQVVISAPRQGESKYDHPHDDAVKLYERKVGKDNIFHGGAQRNSYIFDIFDDGETSGIMPDGGELAKTYAIRGAGGPDHGGMSFTPRTEVSRIERSSRYAG
jgi:competence protein ComEC